LSHDSIDILLKRARMTLPMMISDRDRASYKME
jgi:hypothetical protein